MHKYLYLLTLIFCFTVAIKTKGQGLNITIKSVEPSYSTLILTELNNGNEHPIDTATLDPNKTIMVVKQPKDAQYNLLLNNGKTLSFLIDKKEKDFEILLNMKKPEESEIIGSAINTSFHYFKTFNKKIATNLDLLIPLLNKYPESNFKEQIKKEIRSIWKHQNLVYDSLIAQNQNNILNVIIENSKPYKPDLHKTKEEQINLLKENYFNTFNFEDPRLKNTSLFHEKLGGYLSLFLENDNLVKNDASALYTQATDKIMQTIPEKDGWRQIAYDYLENGFNIYGLPSVATYLKQKYGKAESKGCGTSPTLADEYKRANKEKLAIGNKLPIIKVTDKQGQPQYLKASQKPYTLIAFWFADCNHCQHDIPKIINYAQLNKNENLSTKLISIDAQGNKWISFINRFKNKQVEHYRSPGLWNSKATSTYFLYQTPLYFIVNPQNKITFKAENADAVLQELNSILEK